MRGCFAGLVLLSAAAAAAAAGGRSQAQAPLTVRRPGLACTCPQPSCGFWLPGRLQYAAGGGVPVPCKRWSFRLRDGACRLFGPAAAGTRPASIQEVTFEQREWYSGTGELAGSVQGMSWLDLSSRRLSAPWQLPSRSSGAAAG